MKTLNEQILELIGEQLSEVATREDLNSPYGTIEIEITKNYAGVGMVWASYHGDCKRTSGHPTLESAMTEIRRLRDPQLAVTVAKEKLAAAQKEVQAIEAKIQELSQNQTQTV